MLPRRFTFQPGLSRIWDGLLGAKAARAAGTAAAAATAISDQTQLTSPCRRCIGRTSR